MPDAATIKALTDLGLAGIAILVLAAVVLRRRDKPQNERRLEALIDSRVLHALAGRVILAERIIEEASDGHKTEALEILGEMRDSIQEQQRLLAQQLYGGRSE